MAFTGGSYRKVNRVKTTYPKIIPTTLAALGISEMIYGEMLMSDISGSYPFSRHMELGKEMIKMNLGREDTMKNQNF